MIDNNLTSNLFSGNYKINTSPCQQPLDSLNAIICLFHRGLLRGHCLCINESGTCSSARWGGQYIQSTRSTHCSVRNCWRYQKTSSNRPSSTTWNKISSQLRIHSLALSLREISWLYNSFQCGLLNLLLYLLLRTNV